MHGWMDEWMDEWVWMDGRIGGWIDGPLENGDWD